MNAVVRCFTVSRIVYSVYNLHRFIISNIDFINKSSWMWYDCSNQNSRFFLYKLWFSLSLRVYLLNHLSIWFHQIIMELQKSPRQDCVLESKYNWSIANKRMKWNENGWIEHNLIFRMYSDNDKEAYTIHIALSNVHQSLLIDSRISFT